VSDNVKDAGTLSLEEELTESCNALVHIRNRPLVALYYPEEMGSMEALDADDCYKILRQFGLHPDSKQSQLDVLVHTLGGDPKAAYRLAKCLRYFTDTVTFLVPEFAYSAGTLLCLSGNEIRFGHNAGISPIDISLQSGSESIELTAIDYFMEFVKDSQKEIQHILRKEGIKSPSRVGSDLLGRLVDQVQAIKVGSYYRERMLTRHYAEELLSRFMLVDLPNIEGRQNKILDHLLFKAPAHEFQVDYEQSVSYGLVAQEMTTDESSAAKQIIDKLRTMDAQGIICPEIYDWHRMPFFFYCDGTAPNLEDSESYTIDQNG